MLPRVRYIQGNVLSKRVPTRAYNSSLSRAWSSSKAFKTRDLNEALWASLSRCWALYPASRPTMKQVVRELRELKSLLEPRE